MIENKNNIEFGLFLKPTYPTGAYRGQPIYDFKQYKRNRIWGVNVRGGVLTHK